MRIDRIILVLCSVLSLSTDVRSQASVFADSLQIKAYSLIYVNRQLKVDSIGVGKIYCDYCNEEQRDLVSRQVLSLTRKRYLRKVYDKAGVYRNVLYLRYSKEEFRKLNNQ